MKFSIKKLITIGLFVSLITGVSLQELLAAPPASFGQAKELSRNHVYFDRNDDGDFYCGCNWRWVGRSGGRIDFKSCSYGLRKETQRNRAERTEFEHILPAYNFGRARQCWQDGGRKNCNQTDPVFNAMEADLYNLTPAIGEVNADRSNFNFGMLPDTPYQHGQCDFKVNFKARTAQPREAVRGIIARTYFYMHDRYDLQMSRQQQQLMMAWDKAHPVTQWEADRHNRIAKIMGHSNPFVTREKTWSMGHKNSGEGAQTYTPLPQSRQQVAPQQPQKSQQVASNQNAIRGNKNSGVYHLPTGCPSYDKISPRNIAEFGSEQDAVNAGFRKAGNCR